MTDLKRKAEALDAIFAIMDGEEWSADTTQEIAQVLESVGYEIRDCEEVEDAEPTTREGWWRKAVEDQGDEWTGVLDGTLASEAVSDGPDRYLLVETNVRGCEPPRWYSTFDSALQAADYHINQEYADDWYAEALIDLDTGEVVHETVETTVAVSF